MWCTSSVVCAVVSPPGRAVTSSGRFAARKSAAPATYTQPANTSDTINNILVARLRKSIFEEEHIQNNYCSYKKALVLMLVCILGISLVKHL